METKIKLSTAWKFIIAILLCESVGIISGLLASANNNLWFDALNKPTWNPPAYLFGPVWTTLYLPGNFVRHNLEQQSYRTKLAAIASNWGGPL